MSDDTTSLSARRGSILIDLERYAEAESCFRDALARDPENSWFLTNLAFCELRQQRAAAAFETIRRATSLAPEASGPHALKAYIEIHLARPNDALESAGQALELDPECEDAFTARAAAYIAKGEWGKAEETARVALELNPDHAAAAQQLAYALRLQNRLRESEKHSAYLLEKDPEDSDNHTAAGWIMLQKGERQKAEEHFLEALRLKPGNESAEEGLNESYFAQFPVYKLYLEHQFSMQRFTGTKWLLVYKWLNIIKWLILAGAVGLLEIAHLMLRVIMGSLTAIHMILVLWEDVIRAVSHLRLIFYRSERHTLNRMETADACITGGSVIVGIPLFVVGVIASWPAAIILGTTLVIAALPFTCTFTNIAHGRWLFGAVSAFVIFAGLLNFLLTLSGLPRTSWLDAITGIAVLGILATVWLGNLGALNSRRR